MKYVVLPKPALRELLTGDRTQLPVTDPAPVGSVIAAKVAPKRRPTCLLRVVDCQPDPDGHTLEVRVQPHEHQPRLLAADSSKGYTDKPYLALSGEPEAVEPDVQDQITVRAGLRHSKRVHERETVALASRRLLTVEERVEKARKAARANYVDPELVRRELRALRHMQRRGRPDSTVQVHLEAFERVAYREKGK